MASIWKRPYGPNQGNPSGLNVVVPNVSGATPAPLPAFQPITVNTETVLLNPSLPSPASPLGAAIEPNTALEQIPFDLNISGYIVTAASMTVTLKVYNGTSLTLGQDVLVFTTAAITQNTATAPFWLNAKLIYDSVSGKLTGTFKGNVNNTLVAEAAITQQTGINNKNNPVLSLMATATFSVANAGNAINITDFSIG